MSRFGNMNYIQRARAAGHWHEQSIDFLTRDMTLDRMGKLCAKLDIEVSGDSEETTFDDFDKTATNGRSERQMFADSIRECYINNMESLLERLKDKELKDLAIYVSVVGATPIAVQYS